MCEIWQNNKNRNCKVQGRDGGTLLAGGTTAGGTLFTVGTTDTCTEHTMNRCEPCAKSRSELVQPRGLRLGSYQRRPPRAAPVKSYPQLKGWAPGREMGLRLHNRARYMLHGQSDDVLDRHVIQKIREQRRRSNTGVTVGDLRSGFRDKPPTEAHLSFCFNTNNHNSNFPKRQIVFTMEA